MVFKKGKSKKNGMENRDDKKNKDPASGSEEANQEKSSSPEDTAREEAVFGDSSRPGAGNPHPSVEELEKKAKERDEYLDRLQRTAADFSNYQKRMLREMDETRKYAAAPVALEILSVLDDFERALAAASDQVREEYLQGFRMIEERLRDILARQGVKPIAAEGAPFDPNVHEALMETEDSRLPDRTVVDVLTRGYLIHERLLRPARVRVSRRPPEPEKEDPNSPERDREEGEE